MVVATPRSGAPISTKSSASGQYSLNGIAPGDYQISASFPGMEMKSPVAFVERGPSVSLDLVLTLRSVEVSTSVQAESTGQVSVDPANNATALVLSGDKLDALSDNPNDLASDLQALAGPSAGPNGGAIYIDGFTTGEMPPKESIREVRINQNPFSAEYDTLGIGRIEIFTKPGANEFQGNVFFNIGSDVLNSRNPYAAVKAPFLLREFGTSLAGPISRKASYTLDLRGDATDNGVVINGATLDPAILAIISPFTDVQNVRQRRFLGSPHVDYQLNENNTLSLRYRVTNSDVPNSGLGAFNLAESAYHAHSLAQTTQAIETALLGPNVVNETRFQFFNVSNTTVPVTSAPSVQVLNAFTGGGASAGNSSDVQRNFELQNITTITHGSDAWHFGARIRDSLESNTSRQNFSGTFTFGGETAPELNANNQPVLDPSGKPVLVPITSIQQYQRTLVLEKAGLTFNQVQALGGGASQFTISAGNPFISASQFDLALFLENTWKARQNLTITAGLRYEMQTNISDHHDFAPRVTIAWAPAQLHHAVLRVGSGIFFDRFALANTLTALRYNGLAQQQYVVDNPSFYPSIPSISALAASASKQEIQTNAPGLRAPYLIQTTVGIEKQLPAHSVLGLTYSNSHGLHQLRSEDINVPLYTGGPYPLGNADPVFQAESSGLYNQNLFIANIASQMSQKVSLFGSYTYGKTMSNTDGISSLPANPHSMVGEYAPAATDVRNFETFGGTIQSFWKTTWSPLLTAKSGPPYNITAGRDLYGTTLFNGRPGNATDPTRPGLIQTRYGLLDPAPSPGEVILPRNFGRGPGSIHLNMRLSKTVGFGPTKEAPKSDGQKSNLERRFSLVLTLQMRNLLNHNNPGPIIGNIASPLFGRANQAASSPPQAGTNFSEAATNRRFEFQTRLTF